MEYKFKYYQYSYVASPSEFPVKESLTFNQIHKAYICENTPPPHVYFATYVSEFDCLENTSWWFTIKDSEYNVSFLSAKKRYEITKARKFCRTEKIDTDDYIDEIIECYIESFSGYPELYRPKNFDRCALRNQFIRVIYSTHCRLYGTFFRENNKLIGFNYVEKQGDFVRLISQKTIPSYEKYNSNAALLDCLLEDWNDELRNGTIVITNGSRSIKHQTNFNEYLEKYFGFRKAYSKLQIVYRFPLNLLIPCLKPFIKLFEKSNRYFCYNIFCVLKMDSFKEKKR